VLLPTIAGAALAYSVSHMKKVYAAKQQTAG